MSWTKVTTLLAGAALVFSAWQLQAADPGISAEIAAAVRDTSRPAADKQRDADRKPAESVAFAGIKPGDKVLDFMPGGGYFTRIFAKTVGPQGKVYALVPSEMLKDRPTAADGIKKLAAEPGYGNVSVISSSVNNIKAPEPLDVVWTSLNYHDTFNPMLGPANNASFNKSIFDSLKRGGIYIIIDHAATRGSGARDTENLHRVDAEGVKAEVTGVGFELVGESDLLAHPEDDHTSRVFDSNVRGKTDQFFLKFRKP